MSDQQVSAKAVLDAVMSLRRRGATTVLEELEQVEPDLTNYLLESLSDLHRKLLALGGPAKASQRVFVQFQHLSLVCITALRRGHFELWRKNEGAQLENNDKHPETPEPPAS